jgi:hypothetical protein
MFNGDAATAKEAEKKAQAELKTAQDQAAKAKEAMLIIKAGAGFATDAERGDLAGLRFKEDARKVHADMLKAIEDRAQAAIGARAGEFVGQPGGMGMSAKQVFSWDWPATGELPPAPPKSLIDQTVTYFSQRQLAVNMTNIERQSLADAQKTIQTLSAKLETTNKTLEARVKEVPEEVAKGIKEARDAFEKFKIDYTKLFGDQRKELNDKNDEMNVEKERVRRSGEKVITLTNRTERLEEELGAKIDPFQFDKPQGKILRRTGQIVEIDIGSADNLRPGLTFSVMPADTPQRGFETRTRELRDIDGRLIRRIVPKGSIEVIEILGANLAQARITEEESQVRDRILGGDLLYNAIWRRGTSEHIALYGILDLDGDGRDDIKGLRDELARMGVAVDAYFDLSTLKWVGEITSQTNFAVEGFSPTVSVADGNGPGKARIISAIADARKTVKERGIRVLRPRDFFPRIGYKARVDASENAVNQAATSYIRTLPAAEGGGGEVPNATPPKVDK